MAWVSSAEPSFSQQRRLTRKRPIPTGSDMEDRVGQWSRRPPDGTMVWAFRGPGLVVMAQRITSSFWPKTLFTRHTGRPLLN